jgi:hypothetical protein
MACILIYAIKCVFHLLYQLFYGISICNIRNNDGVNDILRRNKLPSEQV